MAIKNKNDMKKNVTLSIDSKIYDEFHKYCEENAIVVSKKIEIWINDFVNNEKNKKKDGKNEK